MIQFEINAVRHSKLISDRQQEIEMVRWEGRYFQFQSPGGDASQ